MKKLLFISDMDINDKSGATSNGLMHLQLLKKICQDNFIYLGVSPEQDDKKNIPENVRLKARTTQDKIFCILHGYPAYLNKRMRQQALSIVRSNDTEVVFIDNSVSGKFVKELKAKFPKIEIICFFHDIEYFLMKEQLKKARFLRKFNLITMIRNEFKTAMYSDKCVVLNERDARLFKCAYKKTPDFLLPIVLAQPTFKNNSLIHSSNQKIKLLFVGANYYPNVNGIRWFINSVMKNLHNICELTIIGNKMEKYQDEFKSDNVTVLGTVDSIAPFYEETHVIVIPLFEGGGMKVKTGEALIYGKTIIGTPEALTGYWDDMPSRYKNTSVFSCDTELEFTNCIISLYQKEFPIYNAPLSKWANEQYSFETNLKKMSDIIS